MSGAYVDTVESVWDYPRPPRLERLPFTVTIEFDGAEVARTTDAWRVLETSHPPGVYLPRDAFTSGALEAAPRGATVCEWKGQATYLDVVGASGRRAARAAWTYPTPTAAFEPIAGFVAVYPGRVDRCTIDGVEVQAQEGDFYGGWITPNIRGPIKGAPGTRGW